MKKFGYLMGAALLTLGSCTNEINEEGFVDKANTISFSAYSNKTRAYENGDADISVMKTGSFGVVGYKNSDNNLYLGSTTKATEQVWNEKKNAWDYKNEKDKKYWPSGSMDFFAYFPYSDDGATFAATKTDTVMTIKSNNGNQDILFSYIKDRTQTDLVHLYFYHALSKIKSVEIQVAAPDIEVSVSNIEILNSYTKGNIKVDNTGVATYSDGTTPRSVGFSTAKTINSQTAEENRVLFDNTANAYLFATNTTEHEKVKGTGQTMWNGTKDVLNGGKLSESKFICMKVTGKVKLHHTDTKQDEYLVGSADSDGVMYIPLRGNSANSADISEFLAGRRYIYKIVMSSNVGYTDKGDPIMFSYIKFGVNQVYGWSDVIVTINL